MSLTSRESFTSSNEDEYLRKELGMHRDDERTDHPAQIFPEYRFEKPAIDRLLDYIWAQEAQRPAIDKLIQEYRERTGCPLPPPSPPCPSNIPSLCRLNTEANPFDLEEEPKTDPRTIQHYQSTPSFYPTPISSGRQTNAHSRSRSGFQPIASTPLLRSPLPTRSRHSSSAVVDVAENTRCSRMSISSDQSLTMLDRCMHGNASKDSRLKRAAAQERRQATRHFGKVQPGLIWTAPLPVRPRTFSMRPPSLSCKIFLGGIPHDLNPRDLQERLESFGPVRLEWPNMENMPSHRHASIAAGFVYAVYENEESVHQILHTCCTKTDRTLDDGRCEYYLDVYTQRTTLRRKSIQIIPWFVEDSQWLADEELVSNAYTSWEQRYGSTECISRTVFVGALHGMMTAYALARICQELFGEVEYTAIDTDRNKYPIGSGRVVFVNAHSYYAAVTANYLLIECDKFCKVIQIDPYLSDSVACAGANGERCSNAGQFFCRSLKCMKYYCATCWDLIPSHLVTRTNGTATAQEYEPPALIHKPLMRNARTVGGH